MATLPRSSNTRPTTLTTSRAIEHRNVVAQANSVFRGCAATGTVPLPQAIRCANARGIRSALRPVELAPVALAYDDPRALIDP